ncbi:hypothetical protein AB3R30_07295 [Leptolyngbyaceae cyanobacterium UHCC 1019]
MTEIQLAKLTPRSGSRSAIEVQFNPVSLDYSVTNSLTPKADSKTQYTTKTSAKLSLALVFDTTDLGQDVRLRTQKIANLMKPDSDKAPPVVVFEWGTFKFEGMIDSYKETLDFFAPSGVPLRATINLSFAAQDEVFEGDQDNAKERSKDPLVMSVSSGNSLADITSLGGNPAAFRALASANFQETIRFPSGAIALDASIQLNPPVAFATGQVSIGAGVGLGVSGGITAGISGEAGISGGIDAGISGGTGIEGGIGISGGAGIRGNDSSIARISGSSFAGLRSPVQLTRSQVRLNTRHLIQSSESFSYATGAGASFQVGGQASSEGSASLSADVGGAASLQGRIQFNGG